MLQQAFSFKSNWSRLVHRPPQHEAAIDGMRAIAVLIVIASHVIFSSQFFVADAAQQFAALPVWMKWPVQGFLGVDIFFVISGFLIGKLLMEEYKHHQSIRLLPFFARRCLRLMPVFWLALGISVLLASRQHGETTVMNVVMTPHVDAAWKNLLYINNFFRPRDSFGTMSHSWSLAVEEQFYLLFPLLLLLFLKTGLRRHPLKVIAALTLGYLAIRIGCRVHALSLFTSECGYTPAELSSLKVDPLMMVSSEKFKCLFDVETDVMFDNLYTKYIALLAGVIAAYLHTFGRDKLARLYARPYAPDVWMLVSCAVVGFNFLYMYWLPERSAFNAIYSSLFQQLTFSAAIAYLILGAIHGTGPLLRLLRRCLSVRPLYVLAQFSYSMYLFNLLLVHMSYRIAAQLVGVHSLPALAGTTLLILCPLTLLVSLLAYLLVERPFMNLRVLLTPRGQAAPAIAPLQA